MISKRKAWFLAARPHTLPASLGPVILGGSLAGHLLLTKNILIFALTILCALLLQVATNLVNDYFDSERGLDGENRLGPDRALQMGWLKKSELKKGIILAFSLAFSIGTFLMYQGGLPIVIIGISSIIMAYVYTGGPFPLSYYGLGEVLALIFFGPIPVWGTFYLLTNRLDLFPLAVGLIPGLIAMSLMGINNLRDHKNDKAKGKNTLATIFGIKFGKFIILFGVITATLIPVGLFLMFKERTFLVVILLFFINIKNWLRIYNGPIDQELNAVLARTGKFLFLSCIISAIAFSNI